MAFTRPAPIGRTVRSSTSMVDLDVPDPNPEPVIPRDVTLAESRALLSEAFTDLEAMHVELSVSRARVGAARRLWLIIRARRNGVRSARGDVRAAITAARWADKSGILVRDFVDCLEFVESQDAYLRGAKDLAARSDAHTPKTSGGLLFIGSVGDVAVDIDDDDDVDVEAAVRLADVADEALDDPTLPVPPPLDMPVNEPEEGYLEAGLRRAREAAQGVADFVYDRTVQPLVDVRDAALDKVDDAKKKASNLATMFTIGMIGLGFVWLNSGKSR